MQRATLKDASRAAAATSAKSPANMGWENMEGSGGWWERKGAYTTTIPTTTPSPTTAAPATCAAGRGVGRDAKAGQQAVSERFKGHLKGALNFNSGAEWHYINFKVSSFRYLKGGQSTTSPIVHDMLKLTSWCIKL